MSLLRGLDKAGVQSWLAVADAGKKPGDQVLTIRRHHPAGIGPRIVGIAASAIRAFGGRRGWAEHAARGLENKETPSRVMDWFLGREDFAFPGTWSIPDLPPSRPDVIHLHNLHGGYFDLRALPHLTFASAVAVTLHDEWMLTGHCAYTLGCDRWRTGCGACPHLDTYPAVRRDSTARNRLVKDEIYSRSRLHVSAPSRWLLDRAAESTLGAAAASLQPIPNGVDQDIFRPGSQADARNRLQIPDDVVVLVFSASRARTNEFKDWHTVAEAARSAAPRLGGRRVVLITLGDSGATEHHDDCEFRFVPFVSDQEQVANYYRASDAYVHAARADNFPTTVLEALSCGVPVVATAVGGIPEQVRSLAGFAGAWKGPSESPTSATGVLVRPGDSRGMGTAIANLVAREQLRRLLAENAGADAAARFSLDQQVATTISWYHEILALDEAVASARDKA